MRDINFADAQQAVGFLAPQLLRINTEIVQNVYPSFDYASLVPVNTDGDMWDYGSIFYSGDIGGAAKFLNGNAFDMPHADVATSQFMQQNRLGGIGYEWGRQELERAAKMGRNLSSDKAAAASKVAESFIYAYAIRGSTLKNETGLINNTSVPTANVPADGTGSTTTWSTKTSALILRDVNLALNAPTNASGETIIADRLVVPTTRLQYLASTAMGTGDGGYTILKFLQENNAYTAQTKKPLDIRGSRELEAAGASGTARMISYAFDPAVVQFHLPGPHEFFPAWQKNSFVWEVPGLFNVGGVEWRRPKGGAYYDGI
jgi:hypothetical protein